MGENKKVFPIKRQLRNFYIFGVLTIIVLAILVLLSGFIDISKVSKSFLDATVVGLIICLFIVINCSRAKIVIDDDEMIYKDMMMPRRKYRISDIRSIRYKNRAMLVNMANGNRSNIDYVFEDREEFFELLRSKGVDIVSQDDVNKVRKERKEARMVAKAAERKMKKETARAQKRLTSGKK